MALLKLQNGGYLKLQSGGYLTVQTPDATVPNTATISGPVTGYVGYTYTYILSVSGTLASSVGWLVSAPGDCDFDPASFSTPAGTDRQVSFDFTANEAGDFEFAFINTGGLTSPIFSFVASELVPVEEPIVVDALLTAVIPLNPTPGESLIQMPFDPGDRREIALDFTIPLAGKLIDSIEFIGLNNLALAMGWRMYNDGVNAPKLDPGGQKISATIYCDPAYREIILLNGASMIVALRARLSLRGDSDEAVEREGGFTARQLA